MASSRTTGPGSGGTGFSNGTAWTETAINKLPGGLAATDGDASGQSGIGATETTLCSLTFTTISGRYYMVEGDLGISAASAALTATLKITDGSNTALRSRTIDLTSGENKTAYIRYLATGDGTSTGFKLRVVRASGTGTISTGVSLLTVTDVGPSF